MTDPIPTHRPRRLRCPAPLYRCLACGTLLTHEPGPTECPCGSIRLRWLNYDAFDWNGDDYGEHPLTPAPIAPTL